ISFHDVEDGSTLGVIESHARCSMVGFTPDGTSFIGLTHRRLTCWSVADGAALWSVDAEEETMQRFALSPDGGLLAIGYLDGTVRLFKSGDATPIATFFRRRARRCETLTFSGDGRWLAAESHGATIAIIDVASRQVVRTLDDIKGWVRDLAFYTAEDGRSILAGCGHDAAIVLWEIPSGRVIRRFNAHSGVVQAVQFSADGRLLYSGSSDGTIRIWETTPRACQTIHPTPGSVFDIEFTPDGRRLITCGGDDDSSIHVRDAADGRLVEILEGHGRVTSAVSVAPDARGLASIGYDRRLSLWTLDDEGGAREIWSRPSHSGGVGAAYTVDHSPDGWLLASGADNGRVTIWSATDGAPIRSIDLGCWRVASLEFMPDGRRIIAATVRPDRVVSIDVESGAWFTLADFTQFARTVRIAP
ncbi:MAG: WD40 repeat domain-containing protein, partial [Planctomycetota bacterium]|nr:WD40 repeat domain-containing protein [Planctomycetota bacterium]